MINFGHIVNLSISACKDKLLALATKEVPIRRLQNEGFLAITDLKFSSRDNEYFKSLLNKWMLLTVMQVFDKTAIPPKAAGSNFAEYGQEHIDVPKGHYFQGDEVS